MSNMDIMTVLRMIEGASFGEIISHFQLLWPKDDETISYTKNVVLWAQPY